MKNRIATATAIAAALALGMAPAASAATITGSSFAKCVPYNNVHDPDYNVRGEQTYYRTANPTGKILAYKATPTFTTRTALGLPLEYRWVRAELLRSGLPTLVDTRSTGQFGSTGAPAGRAATTTKFGWRIYVAGQLRESLSCSISTPAL